MASEPDFVRRDDDDGVVTLSLCHPDTLNRFSDGSQFQELASHVRRVNADPSARVLIVTGVGKAFCIAGFTRKQNRERHAGPRCALNSSLLRRRCCCQARQEAGQPCSLLRARLPDDSIQSVDIAIGKGGGARYERC